MADAGGYLASRLSRVAWWSGRSGSGRRRYLAVGAFGVALVLILGAVGYRVLAPTETVDRAWTAYPPARPASARVYGTLLASPILMDGRLRVYAGQRHVWADAPVDVKSSMTPYWSYRRWPAQLIGVVTTGTTVISRWSDGELVALDGRRGVVSWHAAGPAAPGAGYLGRRTGATTVYHPLGLFTTGTPGVVLAAGPKAVAAFDTGTGRRLWQRDLPGCAEEFTTAGAFVATHCSGPERAVAYDTATGAAGAGLADLVGLPAVGTLEPTGCVLGNSVCRAVRTPARAWLIGSDGTPSSALALADPGAWLVDDTVVRPASGGGLVGLSATGGRQLWSWPAAGSGEVGRVIAVEPGAVHVYTGSGDVDPKYRYVVTLDPRDGRELSRYLLRLEASGPFELGQVYAADRYLFMERLHIGTTPSAGDTAYYYSSPNVIIAGT